MPGMGRGTVIVRAMRTIKALEKPVSVYQLAEILGINYSSAYYYLQAASLEFPVMEVRGSINGHQRALYQLTNFEEDEK